MSDAYPAQPEQRRIIAAEIAKFTNNPVHRKVVAALDEVFNVNQNINEYFQTENKTFIG